LSANALTWFAYGGLCMLVVVESWRKRNPVIVGILTAFGVLVIIQDWMVGTESHARLAKHGAAVVMFFAGTTVATYFRRYPLILRRTLPRSMWGYLEKAPKELPAVFLVGSMILILLMLYHGGDCAQRGDCEQYNSYTN
jgi:hypothetical protein